MAHVFLVTYITESFGTSVLKIAISKHMLIIIFIINFSYHYKYSFTTHNNTQNAHTVLQLHYTYSFFVLCAEFQVVRTQTEFCRSLSGAATRGHDTFEMLIYLALAGRAVFPQEYATQTPSFKRNITHTISGVLAMFVCSSVQTGGEGLGSTRETEKHGKCEIKEIKIAGNTIYKNGITRKTRDTGKEHRGKREIQGRNIAGNARYRKRTSRETGDENSITGNTRYRNVT